MAGFVKGASTSAEQNIMIGESWMEFARSRIAIQFWSVASTCNCADGPSRYDFSFTEGLGAHFVDPVLPDYLWNICNVAQEPGV